MLIEFIVLLFVFIGMLFYYVNKRPQNFPPVPRISFPILGHFPYFEKYDKIGLYKLMLEWGREAKSSMIGVDFANFRAVVFNDHQGIKQIFSLPAGMGRIHGRAMSLRGGDDSVNRGIVFSEAGIWSEQRKFTIRHLKEFGFGRKSMENVILTEAEELVRGFQKDAGNPICTSSRFNAAIVNSFWQICARERFSHDDPELAKLVSGIIQNVQGAKVIGTLIFMPWFCRLFPKLSGWSTYEENFHKMNNYIKNYIRERKEKHEPGDQNDFIDVYIQEIHNCTDPTSSFYGEEGMKNLLNTLGDIFAAGSETTSTTMSWISLYLSKHPDIQKEAHAEIDHVIGRHRLPSLNDRDLMPFMEAILQETLRLSSVVVLGVFHRCAEDTTMNGYFIPKDTVLISNIYGANHDPKVWGVDADAFNPARFLSPDKTKFIKNDAMIAFSTGRRVCIGEALARNELFLFTTAILQKFNILPDPECPGTLEPNFGGTVAGPLYHKLIFQERN